MDQFRYDRIQTEDTLCCKLRIVCLRAVSFFLGSYSRLWRVLSPKEKYYIRYLSFLFTVSDALAYILRKILHEPSNVSSSSSDSSTLRSSSTSCGSSTSYDLSNTYNLSTLSSSSGYDQHKQGSKSFWANYIHDLESI